MITKIVEQDLMRKATFSDGQKADTKIKSVAKVVNFSNDADADVYGWCIAQQEKKKSFSEGERNAFITSLAYFLLEKGCSESHAISESVKRYSEPGFTGDEIERTIKNIYRNHSGNFASKRFTPTQAKATPIQQDKRENIFLIRSANRCLQDASALTVPNQLCSELWHEGELCILFAGAGIGKSLLSVQIADGIARGGYNGFFKTEADPQAVLYFDFELSVKQFEKRYSENFSNHYQFADNFFRIEINPDAENFTGENFSLSIEETIQQTGAKILIIDNITYLGNNLEESRHALPLMKHLKQLKKKLNLSILVLAHTPKRDQTRAMTINDLSGSMMLANFADSVFCINTSVKDKSARYIKQVKARATEVIFDSENVPLFEIRNDYNFTGFHFIGFDREANHLKDFTEKEQTGVESAILELHSNGKSLREISRDLNLSYSKVHRTINKKSNDEF